MKQVLIITGSKSDLPMLADIDTIPKGVPLVTTGIGKVGFYNAGLFVAKLV
jgi:phosphoribosylcarboxyaminoimidazole (NCAIR) mutase